MPKILKNKTTLSLFFLVLFVILSIKSSTAQGVLTPCDINATDQENNSFEFLFTKNPLGLSINPSSGIITGTVNSAPGDYITEVEAVDEYGAASDPAYYNLRVDSYCGDNEIQKPNSENRGGPLDDGYEECDGMNGVAYTAADSGPNRTYACTATCTPAMVNCAHTCEFDTSPSTSGWCGDGEVQTTHPVTGASLETCDPGETMADYTSRTGRIVSFYEYEAIKMSCVDCNNSCVGDIDLASGCYIDTNSNGVLDNGECQKGLFVCGSSASLDCIDVFTPHSGKPMFDYCCSTESEKLACAGNNAGPCASVEDIGAFYRTRANSSDVVFTSAGGFYGDFTGVYANTATTFYFYTCDYVCSQTGRVCIGVGLTNHETTSCISVVHDGGGLCLNSGNTVYDDCRSYFSLAGASTASYDAGYNFAGYLGTCADNSVPTPYPTFNVGETMCYCQ